MLWSRGLSLQTAHPINIHRVNYFMLEESVACVTVYTSHYEQIQCCMTIWHSIISNFRIVSRSFTVICNVGDIYVPRHLDDVSEISQNLSQLDTLANEKHHVCPKQLQSLMTIIRLFLSSRLCNTQHVEFSLLYFFSFHSTSLINTPFY